MRCGTRSATCARHHDQQQQCSEYSRCRWRARTRRPPIACLSGSSFFQGAHGSDPHAKSVPTEKPSAVSDASVSWSILSLRLCSVLAVQLDGLRAPQICPADAVGHMSSLRILEQCRLIEAYVSIICVSVTGVQGARQCERATRCMTRRIRSSAIAPINATKIAPAIPANGLAT